MSIKRRYFPTLSTLCMFSGIATLAWVSQVHAAIPEDGHRSYLGVLGGATSSEGVTSPSIGVNLGTRIGQSLGLGLLGTFYGQTSSGTLLGLPTGTSASTVVLAAQALFHVGGLRAGGEIGTAISSWSGYVSRLHTGSSTASFIAGPLAGYDLLIGNSLSLGLEGHYLFSRADQGVDNIQLFASVKLWQ